MTPGHSRQGVFLICGLTSLQEKKFFCLAPDAAFFCFSARKNQIGQQVTCFCIASILGGFDFPYRGNEEKLHQERTQGFSAAAPVGALIVCHWYPGPLFSCKRGPLVKYPPGIFHNSPPKMRPTVRVRGEFRSLRRAARGSSPLDPRRGAPAGNPRL